MKKIILLLIILVGSTTIASAQFVKFGVKGGLNINSSDFVVKNTENAINAVKNNAGYHIGITTRINLMALYIQGDILYNHNSHSYNLDGGNMKVKENKLSVPVVAGLDILFLRVYAGPRFDFNLGNNLTKSIGNADIIKETLDNRWLGYQIGIGTDILSRISLDISYNGYFKAPTQSYKIGTTNVQIKQKTRQYWFTIGYYFGSGNNKYM